MGISSATVWEVRPAAGNDTNGGGFVAGASGTDYSQQNSKNTGGNNQSTTDAVGIGTTTLTSATASFTSAIVGNLIYLTGTGATTGWYQVTAFTNSTTVTLDRNPGTGTGWTMNIGGALASISPFTSASTDFNDGNTVWITGTVILTTRQTANAHLKYIGYTSSRGDGGRATITTSTNSTDLFYCQNSGYSYLFQNIIFSNTASVRGKGFDGTGEPSQAIFVNCVFDGVTIGYDGGYAFVAGVNVRHTYFIFCEFKNCTTYGARFYDVYDVYLFACFIHDNSGPGISINGDSGFTFHVSRTVFYNNTGSGFENIGGGNSGGITGVGARFENCAFVQNTGDGLKDTGAGAILACAVSNCIFDSNGGYGINAASNSVVRYVGGSNAFYNNTNGERNNFPTLDGDVTLTGSPFTNPSGGDFTLNNTAGAGASCKGAGYPNSLP